MKVTVSKKSNLEIEVERIHNITDKKVSKNKIRNQLTELITDGRNGDSRQSYEGIRRYAIKYLTDYYKNYGR